MKPVIEQIEELSLDNSEIKEKMEEQDLRITALQTETEYIACILELQQQ